MDIGIPPQPKGKRAGLGPGSGPAAAVAYRVTLSARDDASPFGLARGGETVLNARGKALASAWRELGESREGVRPDALSIGPRRLEGILLLASKRSGGPDLAVLIRFFKVISALRLAQLAKTSARGGANASPDSGAPGARKPSRAASARPLAEADAGAKMKSPAPLWKQGYAGKQLRGSAALAEARKALAGMQAR